MGSGDEGPQPTPEQLTAQSWVYVRDLLDDAATSPADEDTVAAGTIAGRIRRHSGRIHRSGWTRHGG